MACPLRVLGGGSAAVLLCYLYMRRTVRRMEELELHQEPRGARRIRVGVDSEFVRNMRKLLPILFPAGILSREAGLLSALAAVLIARTWLDIWFSGFNGAVVKAIVMRDRKAFVARAVVEFGLMMWPLSIVNNSLKLCISSISLAFRSRLTRHAHNLYLSNLTFYKIASGSVLSAPDQLLTQDIDRFADSLSHLYSNIAKPLVDIFLFAYKLGQAIGGNAPFFMISYFFCSGFLLRSLSPPFGKYAAMEQKLEGDYRFTHSRIITHSEEIAFYGGGEREKSEVNSSFRRIFSHLSRLVQLRFANGVVDSIFVKYLATMLAYTVLARPILNSVPSAAGQRAPDSEASHIVEDYQRNSGYLVNLSQAIGRILLAGRDLTRFAGYSARVAELFRVLETTNSAAQVAAKSASASHGKKICCDGIIQFDSVPIVTPANEVLIDSLTFTVKDGMNCLVTGPNGCGKSSLFRILGDLWPLCGGTITKPKPEGLFYVPQKPYLALGTLRDQVIYPHSVSVARSRGYTDSAIIDLLSVVRLRYLVDRDGGIEAVLDWAAALSGGEKQRIAMARLFYHKPQFAILDECTSAVSVDVEGIMYEHAKKIGITLFTVSHRTSLFKYHDYLLQFDGEGKYKFGRMDPETHTPFSFALPKKQVE